jgi:hypothetical protein
MLRPARYLAFVILALAPAAAATAEPKVVVIDHGLYETGQRTQTPMPMSVSGTMNLVGHVRLISSTREIVGQLGDSFGFRYRVLGVPPGETITIRTNHPMLTSPETGRSMTYGQRDDVVTSDGERYTGFSFDARYEIAEGQWSFQVIYKGKVLAEETFKVVVPLN